MTDIVGKTFGRLTVIKRVLRPGNVTSTSYTFWKCTCSCGNDKIVGRPNLISGGVKSCGCLFSEIMSHNNIEEVKLMSAKNLWSRGYNDGNLSFEQFYKLSQMNCYYCNESVLNSKNSYNFFGQKKKGRISKFAIQHGNFIYHGLDRIDNNKLHDIENIVTCCRTCNQLKMQLHYSIFIKLIDSLKLKHNMSIKKINKSIKLSKLFLARNKYENRNIIMLKIKSIRAGALKRNLSISLTPHECAEFLQSNCFYCEKNALPKDGIFNGIDRLDSSVGYNKKNCVPACKNCNIAKGTLDYKSFALWIGKVKSYLPILIEKIRLDERFVKVNND